MEHCANWAREIRSAMYRSLLGSEPGLIGYWPFDEGTGQLARDSTGLSVAGSLGNNTNPESSDPAWVISDAPIDVGCIGDETTLCLNQNRFRVEITWMDFQGNTGRGRVVPRAADDSGLFWFFAPDNWEMLVKVLDGCSLNDRYWVFAAATTDVEFNLLITDTNTGESATYFNALANAPQSITDTSALARAPDMERPLSSDSRPFR